MPQTFNSGSVNFIDYDGTGDTAVADALLLNMQSTVLNTFTAGIGSDASIVKITAVKKAASLIASELNITTSQASALDGAVSSVASGDTSGLAAMQAILTTGVTQDNVEQLHPDVGAANGASLVSVNATNNVIAGRQANTKVAFNSLGNQSGVSTGDSANDLTVWAQIFGSNANQDKIGSIDGYDADSSGLAVGWETTKSDDLFGFSMSYADANVDGKSASVSHTDSTAVQASVYGTYNKATDWMVGYALADNDTSRTVNFNSLNRTAAGKYDSGIMSAKIGHTFESTGSFAPKVDASWTHVENEGYTETGANNLGLVVGDSDHDVITLRAGGEYSSTVNAGTTRFSVMGGYDVVNDNVETTSTFIGGGSTFTTKGADPEKVSLQLGFGYDLVSDDSTVSIDLGTDIRDAYDNTTASITLKSKF
jgi:outer membrane autotransporter protein